MTHVKLELNIKTQSPLHIGSGLGWAGIVDRTVVRNGAKAAYIPGSTLKGKVRYHCERLARRLNEKLTCGNSICKTDKRCIICRLFGSPFMPGSLTFHDALLVEELGGELAKSHLNTRTNVQISRARRVALEQHLFTSEHAVPQLLFTSTVEGNLPAKSTEGLVDDDLPFEIWLLLSGIRLVEMLGGGCSRGSGSCLITPQKLQVGENDLTATIERLLSSTDYLEGVKMYDDLP